MRLGHQSEQVGKNNLSGKAGDRAKRACKIKALCLKLARAGERISGPADLTLARYCPVNIRNHPQRDGCDRFRLKAGAKAQLIYQQPRVALSFSKIMRDRHLAEHDPAFRFAQAGRGA